jgi:rhomboid family GlyGly-CTERM serine protease
MQLNRRISPCHGQALITWQDPLIAVLIMLFLQPFLPHVMYWRDHLSLDPWRWLTGHWVHANAAHVILNAIALLLLPYVLPAPTRRQFWGLLLSLSALLSVCLFFLNPVLQQYVGLSGVLHGLYACMAVYALRLRHEWRFAFVVLGALGVKLLLESTFGAESTAQLIGVPVYFSAHREGSVLGLLLGVLGLVCQKRTAIGQK